MSKDLIVEEIRGNRHVEKGRLSGDQVVLGRDKDCGIHVTSSGVSWQHGIFQFFGGHWLYKDLGSTNGSWINGVQLNKDRWTIIRPGDALQVADTALAILAPSGQGAQLGMSGRSLLVFLRGTFLQEFSISEYGRSLVVGGTKADLKLDVDVHELPSLIIETRGDRIVAFSIAREAQVFRNGEEFTSLVTLADRDEVSVGAYSIILNDPNLGQEPKNKEAAPSRLQDWSAPSRQAVVGRSQDTGGAKAFADTLPRSAAHLPFGKAPLESDDEPDMYETVALDPNLVKEQLSGYDMHPSRRYVQPDEPPSMLGLQSVEDKIMFLIGMILFVALMAVVLWWVFFV